jgi:quinol monooxygenase YgiN
MIIVSGWIQLDPAKVAEALAAAAPFIRPVREWDGCLDYAWNADGIEPGRVYIYERWADEASFAAHLAGENYRNMRAHMGQYGAQAAEVLKYRIDLAEPVYDDTGTARADFFTDPDA